MLPRGDACDAPRVFSKVCITTRNSSWQDESRPAVITIRSYVSSRRQSYAELGRIRLPARPDVQFLAWHPFACSYCTYILGLGLTTRLNLKQTRYPVTMPPNRPCKSWSMNTAVRRKSLTSFRVIALNSLTHAIPGLSSWHPTRKVRLTPMPTSLRESPSDKTIFAVEKCLQQTSSITVDAAIFTSNRSEPVNKPPLSRTLDL